LACELSASQSGRLGVAQFELIGGGGAVSLRGLFFQSEVVSYELAIEGSSPVVLSHDGSVFFLDLSYLVQKRLLDRLHFFNCL